MPEPKGIPIAEYAQPIHESWDRQGITPPEGYSSWMAYHNAEYGMASSAVEHGAGPCYKRAEGNPPG